MALRATRHVLARVKQTGPPGKEPKLESLPLHQRKLLEILRPIRPPPPRTPEERVRLRALMIRFGKLKRQQHLELEIRQRTSARAMWAAIDALPHARRVEAVETKADQYPEDLRVWTETPPIKGFNMANLSKKK